MEKIVKRGKHTGYKIGNDIEVHNHIHYPDDWLITIRNIRDVRNYIQNEIKKQGLRRYNTKNN
jgi:hypothetical protein